MSERMTDERWNHLNASETVWTKREQAEVAGEVNALQIDVMEKDAVIKALADALWDARQYGDEPDDLCWCQAPCSVMAWRNPKCEGKVATLHLAGRL